MSKAWLVAKREFLSNLRRRSFLFAAFGAPLITIAAMVIVVSLTIESVETRQGIEAVGYVDQAGVLAAGMEQPEDFTAYESEDEARAAFDAQDIDAYFIVPENYLQSGRVSLYTRSTGETEALNSQINAFLVANLGADLDPLTVERLQDPLNNQLLTLDNGRTIAGAGLVGVFLTPLIFVMVFMLASQTSSGYLMSSVVEEKSNRIMEVLITSVTPLQLLFGKIVGLGALGLLQVVIWIVAGLIALQFGQGSALLSGIYIPVDMLIMGLVYFLLSYFLMSSIMAGVGSVTGAEQESRQVAGIFSLLLFLPFFFMVQLLTDPNGTIAVILSLFPFTAPITVIVRMAFSVVPAWQLVVSIAILLGTTLFMMWAAARIFRWSLLMYGKRPSLRQIVGALRRPTMETTATGERAA